MSREELNIFLKMFCPSARKKDGKLSVDKSSSIKKKHVRAAIHRFLRSLPLNEPFSVTSEPTFPEVNEALEHLLKTSEKTGNIASVLEPRNGKKPTSSEQIKKSFDSGDLGRTESKIPHNCRGRLSFTSVSFSVDEEERINAS